MNSTFIRIFTINEVNRNIGGTRLETDLRFFKRFFQSDYEEFFMASKLDHPRTEEVHSQEDPEKSYNHSPIIARRKIIRRLVKF